MTASILTAKGPLHSERISALQHLGYTPRQAEFLTLAALHSGAFIARQFSDFSDTSAGRNRDDLITKLITKGHANRRRTLDATVILQLRKPIFRALGELDNRNRRPLTDDKVLRRRMQGLDFVLRHPQYSFLPTEHEKCSYLYSLPGIDPAVLPGQRYIAKNRDGFTDRSFVDKQPVFGIPGGAGFAYIDTDHSARCFETFLLKLRSLFTKLPAAKVVFVTTEPASVPAHTAIFARFTAAQKKTAGLFEMEIEFRERQSLENGLAARKIALPQVDRLMDLRKSKHAFLYPQWLENGLADLKATFQQQESSAELAHVEFVPCVLTTAYSFLAGPD